MDENTTDQHGLEPQQYERLYWEEDIPVKNITRGVGRWLLLVCLVLFVGIMITAAVVKYPDQIELPFVLRSDDKGDTYSFPFAVYVREVFVQPGQTVEAGQPLIRITSPEIAAMLADLSSQSSKTDAFESFTESAYSRQKDILNKQIAQLRTRHEQLKDDLDLVEQRWAVNASTLRFNENDANERYEASKQLYADGIVSRLEMQEKEKALEIARDALDAGKTEYERSKLALDASIRDTEQAIQSTELEISRLAFEKGARSEELKGDLGAAEGQLESIFGQHRVENGSVILLSPSSAIVSFVYDGESAVAPSVTALKLSTSRQADYAFVKCPPSFMGKVDVGMKANLKVASFPYYEWGTVKGHVDHASLAPDENGEYNLHLGLDELNKLDGMLFAGLDGFAVIVLEEKTILQYFFRRLSKAYYSTRDGAFVAEE